jgi:hypothetical protein
MNKYCYTAIGINKGLDQQYTWYAMLFVDTKIAKGCGQLAMGELKGNFSHTTDKSALKEAKSMLKALGARRVKQ